MIKYVIIGAVIIILLGMGYSLWKKHFKTERIGKVPIDKIQWPVRELPPMKPRVRHVHKTLEGINQDLREQPKEAADSIKSRLHHCISEITKIEHDNL